jgi:O-antigen/teichoic acid export membrane protein
MLTGGAILISRGITSGTGLISIPLTAHSLGNARSAIWLILSSFLSWASVANLDLASSLTNILIFADSNDDQKMIQSLALNTFYLLLILSCWLLSFVLLSFSLFQEDEYLVGLLSQQSQISSVLSL